MGRNGKLTFLFTALASALALLPGPIAMGQIFFEGGIDDAFDDRFNWDPDIRVPGIGDIAIHDPAFDTGNGRILMDKGPSGDPWTVQQFRVEGAWSVPVPGRLTFRQYCNWWTEETDCGPDDFSGLNAQDGMSSDVLNAYVIEVGPEDLMFVGDPVLGGTHNPTASATGFEWDLHGSAPGQPAWVAVTGTIGPGRWNVQYAQIRAGTANTQWDVDDPVLIGDGVIDGGVFGPLQDGQSTWRIDGLDLLAVEARNLDNWWITSLLDQGNRIAALEYFEVNTMVWFASPHLGTGNGDLFVIRMPDGDPGADDEVGLHVKKSLSMLGATGECVLSPYVEAWHLNVRRDAQFDMNATSVSISEDGEPSRGHARFQDGSVLSYGGDACIPGPCCDFQRFEVYLADLPAGRLNALTFEGDSWIMRGELPGALGAFDLDLNLLATSLVINSTVSEAPAIKWDTRDVDVKFEVEPEVTPTFELIAEDSCNLWFADLPLNDPSERCQKHWRSLRVAKRLNQQGGTLKLVDATDNHVCGTPETPPPPPDGALYLVGHQGSPGNLTVDSGTTLDMNDLAVYYGGVLTNNGTILNAPPGFPMRLKMTVYGDFDGDCDVDNDDVQIISDFLGSALSRCDWPLADSNADCQVDFLDVAKVMSRIGIQQWPGCDPEETTNCSAPEGGFGSQEEPPPAADPGFSTFADAMVAFTAGQAPADSEELRLLNRVMDSLLSVCRGRFDVDQRARLAGRLESRDIEFASREAAACAASFAGQLRE